ncbi:MAG: RIP metalloprotease RseP [Candidatus Omnitrophota bacterium]|nr:RIP metalloprotease RseP [Candidatus Omnitrophota bacterium]
MNSWLAFLLTLSLIILVHEWGHFICARAIGVKVERFSFGFGPLLLRWTRSGTEYVLSLLPFGGYVKLAGEAEEGQGGASKPWEYRSRSVIERGLIVLAGPLINYALGFLLFFGVFMAGSPIFTSRVGNVIEGYPAAEAGLKVGDRILAVDGQPVDAWEQMTLAIQARPDAVTLTVERDGKTFPQIIRPKVIERTNLFGAKTRTGMVGITPSDEVRIQRYSPPRAFLKAGSQVWFLTHATLQSLWAIATGGLSMKESFTGPIGIFHITAAVAAQGITPLLQLIAVLSTSIGLFNLLPVPVLDGGHLAFLAVEKLRGKAVSSQTQERMTRVGLGLLLLLLTVVTYNDLLRFNIGGRLMGLFQ